MDKKIIKLDASALSQSSCLLRFKRIVLEGYTDKIPYNDTQYGSAFHKFMATMQETNGDFARAIIETNELFNRPCNIRKKHLTELHLNKTCIDYWQHFQQKDTFQVMQSSDGKPLVETDFAIPYFENDKYVVMLQGTIDKHGKFQNGCYAI